MWKPPVVFFQLFASSWCVCSLNLSCTSCLRAWLWSFWVSAQTSVNAAFNAHAALSLKGCFWVNISLMDFFFMIGEIMKFKINEVSQPGSHWHAKNNILFNFATSFGQSPALRISEYWLEFNSKNITVMWEDEWESAAPYFVDQRLLEGISEGALRYRHLLAFDEHKTN